jgi:hypothetical protein
VPFRIDADQPGSPTATNNATFVQTPMVPERIVSRLIGLMTVAAVLLVGWFGVIKPAIEDAADTAVRNAVPETTTTLQPTIDSETGVTIAPTLPTEEEGTIINIPLSVSVPVGQSDAAVYKVPAGQKLRITDILVQNPNQDQGSLYLLRGSVPLYTFGLANIFGDVSAPLITPIELLSGEELVVQVTCTSQGDQTLTTCFENVFASGILLPA